MSSLGNSKLRPGRRQVGRTKPFLCALRLPWTRFPIPNSVFEAASRLQSTSWLIVASMRKPQTSEASHAVSGPLVLYARVRVITTWGWRSPRLVDRSSLGGEPARGVSSRPRMALVAIWIDRGRPDGAYRRAAESAQCGNGIRPLLKVRGTMADFRRGRSSIVGCGRRPG